MDTFTLVFIISIGVFALSVIILLSILLYKLSSRKYVHGRIFTKTGSQKKIKFHRLKDKQKNVDGETFIFDERAVIKTVYKDFIYFMEGNPYPLIYDFKTSKPEIVGKDLKQILDSDLVQKLFADEDMKLLKLLVIIVIIITVLNLIIALITMFGSGVTIKQSEENYAFLYNITRNAIMGV